MEIGPRMAEGGHRNEKLAVGARTVGTIAPVSG